MRAIKDHLATLFNNREEKIEGSMDARNGIDQNDLKKYNTLILHPSDF